MVENVKAYIKQHQMLEVGDYIVIGVSGGADSVCLLFVLRQLQEEYQLQLTVVHVNHNIRGESARRDQAYVEELCRRWDVQCKVYSLQVEEISKLRKRSVEETGRDLRREVFLEVLEEEHATKIATAHHANDNVETLIMNMSRGTGLTGMTGIQPMNDMWIRPLLGVKRQDIQTYLQQEGIAYCTDETNQENIYTRNRIRNEVIPLLEGHINRQAVSHWTEVIEECRQIEAYLQRQVDKAWGEVMEVANADLSELCVKGQEYAKLDTVIRDKLIKRGIEVVAKKQRDITRAHVKQVQELLEKQVGRVVHLPYGVIAKRTYEGVELYKESKNVDIEDSWTVEVWIDELECGELWEKELPNGGRVSVEILQTEEHESLSLQQIQEDPYTKYFDCDIIGKVVRFRPKQIGDRLTIHKEGNTQTVKKYCVTNKIPVDQRENMMLMVTDSQYVEVEENAVSPKGNVIWIMGYRTSEAYLLSEKTKKIIKVRYNGGIYGRNN